LRFAVALPSNAHTYRLLIFKEPVLLHPCLAGVCSTVKSFCLSAAKRSNYAAFPATRQLLFLLPACWLPPFRPTSPLAGNPLRYPVPHALQPVPINGSRTISKVAEAWQALFQKSRHPFLLIGQPKRAVKQSTLQMYARIQRQRPRSNIRGLVCRTESAPLLACQNLITPLALKKAETTDQQVNFVISGKFFACSIRLYFPNEWK
jgi:hypothetical protein